MSPCDTCSRPGACFRGFVLSLNFHEEDWQGAARSRLDGYGLTYFRIDEAIKTEHTLANSVGIRCSCDRLGEDGRCTDYDNRPMVCRTYDPLYDGLCAEFVGPSPNRPPEHYASPS